MNKIHLFTTGGTIDKRYDATTGNLWVGVAAITEILSKAGLDRNDLCISQIMQKDSLNITTEERDDLTRLVSNSISQRILITHGTDTMNETAEAISRVTHDKTIILTGAMMPHSMADSDASFNIGFAYAAAKLMPPGVYIAMHGRVLPHSQYQKAQNNFRFETK